MGEWGYSTGGDVGLTVSGSRFTFFSPAGGGGGAEVGTPAAPGSEGDLSPSLISLPSHLQRRHAASVVGPMFEAEGSSAS